MKKRSTNIELLRILCMLMVIVHHCYTHTPWELSAQGLSEKNEILFMLTGIWPAVSINCFILMTGYYMCVSKGSISLKIVKLWIDRWFYAVAITIGMVILGRVAVSGGLIARTLFPVITGRHNYVTTFFFCIS